MDELMALNFMHVALAMAVALAGMFTHYVKKWLRGETDDTLMQYLFPNGAWKYTAQAVLAVISAVLSLFITGYADVSTLAGLTAIFTIGYTCDSLLNKDSSYTKPKAK